MFAHHLKTKNVRHFRKRRW